MRPETLDFYFPFIVLVYGLVMTFVLGNKTLMTLARERLPNNVYERFRSKHVLSIVCLAVGTVWALQNIWLS